MIKFLLPFLLATTSLCANPFSEVPQSMQNDVELLMHFPDTKAFLQEVSKQGSIKLKWVSLGSNDFNAFWSAEIRMIGLNGSRYWHPGQKVYSILFELHNAYVNEELIHLDKLAAKKLISKEQYVEWVERIEYQNVMKTATLLQKGVSLGYFPTHTYIPYMQEFQAHLKLQQQCGHSAYIAEKYDDLGSMPLPEYLR